MTDKPTDAPVAHRVTAFDLVSREPWAITPDMLQTIAAIARRENDGPEALEARQGRTLQNTRTVTQRGNVALVPVTGPVFRYANLFTALSGATSLDVLAKEFSTAVDDPRTDSIILVMDSPGGQASGIAEFAQMIRASPKRVIAYVSGNAASACYWMAAAAHEIVMSRTGAVGSIGTVLSVQTNKEDGSVEIVSSQSPKKRPDFQTAEGRALAQNHVDRLTTIFIEDVANYRNVDVDTVLADFGQGDMRIGSDAVELGMADRESTLETLIAELNGSKTGDQSMSNTNSNSPAAPAGDKPVIDRDYLAANHAELLSTLEHSAFAAGAKAESERIQSIEAAGLPGHEELIASLKFDGKTTGAEAANKVIAAEKSKRSAVLSDIRSSGAKPVPAAVAPNPVAEAPDHEDPDMPLEERAQAKWDSDKELRAEFGTFSSYHAYRKAADKGLIKVLKK
jgi:ClpP class serine protease